MSPEKALELVHRYSALTWAIKGAAVRIAEALDRCTGLDGQRLERRRAWERGAAFGALGTEVDPEANDKAVHLREWYSPELVEREWGPPGREWNAVGESQREECPHCFAAHLAIQERKAARKALGPVKAAMTRTTPKPADVRRGEAFQPWEQDHA